MKLLLLVLFFSHTAYALDRYDIEMLVSNCIYETANASEEEKIAVVHVVLNRVADKRFPSSIKSVVLQRKQFSWTNDIGRLREPTLNERRACFKAVLKALNTTPHPYNHYYLATINTPHWAVDQEYKTIDKHNFLKL